MDKFKAVLSYVAVVVFILFLIIGIGQLLKMLAGGIILLFLCVLFGYVCLKAFDYLIDNSKWPFN